MYLKAIFLFAFCCITFFVSFSQSDSLNINQQIFEAAQNDDLKRLEYLKEKKKILLRIKQYEEAKKQFHLKRYKGYLLALEENYKKDQNKVEKFKSNTSIMRNGIFLDLMAGTGGLRLNYIRLWNVGAKVGHKHYFTENKFYRPGFQFTWVKFNMLLNNSQSYREISISPANVGFSNLFEFKPNIGAEINLTFGLTTILQSSYFYRIFYGYSFSNEFKFRYKFMSFGLEANMSKYFYDQNGRADDVNANFYSITVGIILSRFRN